jgi:hypothetical protein
VSIFPPYEYCIFVIENALCTSLFFHPDTLSFCFGEVKKLINLFACAISNSVLYQLPIGSYVQCMIIFVIKKFGCI